MNFVIVYVVVLFLDPKDWSKKATLVAVVGIGSLKIPKAFLMSSGAHRNFAYICAHIPYRCTASDFQLT